MRQAHHGAGFEANKGWRSTELHRDIRTAAHRGAGAWEVATAQDMDSGKVLLVILARGMIGSERKLERQDR